MAAKYYLISKCPYSGLNRKVLKRAHLQDDASEQILVYTTVFYFSATDPDTPVPQKNFAPYDKLLTVDNSYFIDPLTGKLITDYTPEAYPNAIGQWDFFVQLSGQAAGQTALTQPIYDIIDNIISSNIADCDSRQIFDSI